MLSTQQPGNCRMCPGVAYAVVAATSSNSVSPCPRQIHDLAVAANLSVNMTSSSPDSGSGQSAAARYPKTVRVTRCNCQNRELMG